MPILHLTLVEPCLGSARTGGKTIEGEAGMSGNPHVRTRTLVTTIAAFLFVTCVLLAISTIAQASNPDNDQTPMGGGPRLPPDLYP